MTYPRFCGQARCHVAIAIDTRFARAHVPRQTLPECGWRRRREVRGHRSFDHRRPFALGRAHGRRRYAQGVPCLLAGHGGAGPALGVCRRSSTQVAAGFWASARSALSQSGPFLFAACRCPRPSPSRIGRAARCRPSRSSMRSTASRFHSSTRTGDRVQATHSWDAPRGCLMRWAVITPTVAVPLRVQARQAYQRLHAAARRRPQALAAGASIAPRTGHPRKWVMSTGAGGAVPSASQDHRGLSRRARYRNS